MSGGGVDGNEMLPPDPIDEDAFDAFLAGRPAPGPVADSLVAFAQDADLVATGPAPAPKGSLAALLRDGFSPQAGVQGAPGWAPTTPSTAADAAAAPRPTQLPDAWVPPPRPLGGASEPAPPGKRRLRLVPKLAGLGLAAKVGLGFGVAAASVTGAGAAGVLPDPAQQVVATVVDTVTPFEIPDPRSARPTRGETGGGGIDPGPAGRGTGSQGTGGGRAGITPVGGTNPSAGGGAGGQGQGVGPSPSGATGLDRANETPAAGNAPTSVPVPPTTTASPGQQGLDRANETPAAGHVPTSPGNPGSGDSPGQRGPERAGETPAAVRLPPTTTTVLP